MSWDPTNRTCTFCASGAATRKVTLRSPWMQGYGAPGIFNDDGLQSSGTSPQSKPQVASASAKILISSPSITPSLSHPAARLMFTSGAPDDWVMLARGYLRRYV